ncbi:DUF427 domain-containing protein [Rhizosaccharibacter radicis]|uniref:DUF427 domain-containing protein n=1 Tax=Rhizosaccharibacter radicis TaxID=2782605 RepID=A0ABT1W0G9_9PROT|nr:DUF427 domain-containing protein [Acetobacteraceae bacterium KSS12]
MTTIAKTGITAGATAGTADHPIRIEPAPGTVRVLLGGATVADSSRALILRESTYPPVFYVPRADVSLDRLAPSGTRTHCPYKGDASYFAHDGRDVAWSYETPFAPVAAIAGHVAFYPDRVDDISAG